MSRINYKRTFDFVDWECIYWGIKEKLIDSEDVITYADETIERNPEANCSEVIELLILDTLDRNTILSLSEKLMSKNRKTEKGKEISVRKLRYAILSEVEYCADNKKMLDMLNDIYAEFDYPRDMAGFISYMPVNDTEYNASEHSNEENESRLIEKFKFFLEKEYRELYTQDM